MFGIRPIHDDIHPQNRVALARVRRAKVIFVRSLCVITSYSIHYTKLYEIDARVCDCCGTAAVALADGGLLVYRDRSVGDVRDIAIVRIRDGGFEPPRIVHADGWVIRGCPVNGPALAMRDDRVAVLWFTAAGDERNNFV